MFEEGGGFLETRRKTGVSDLWPKFQVALPLSEVDQTRPRRETEVEAEASKHGAVCCESEGKVKEDESDEG